MVDLESRDHQIAVLEDHFLRIEVTDEGLAEFRCAERGVCKIDHTGAVVSQAKTGVLLIGKIEPGHEIGHTAGPVDGQHLAAACDHRLHAKLAKIADMI